MRFTLHFSDSPTKSWGETYGTWEEKPCGPTASSPVSEHPGSMQAFLSLTAPYSPNAGNRRQDKSQVIVIFKS